MKYTAFALKEKCWLQRGRNKRSQTEAEVEAQKMFNNTNADRAGIQISKGHFLIDTKVLYRRA